MLRMGVPVATPILPCDCRAAFAAAVRNADHVERFEDTVRHMLDVPFLRAANSARSALYFVLHAMRRNSDRDEVVLPAYACPSIGRSAFKAGLKPVLCDVGRNGSGLNAAALERIVCRRTLAVVAAHLYGYPCDVTVIAEMARGAGAFFIEDAAQAFGAKFNARYVGTQADAAIFSFGMSKVLWGIGGGIAVTRDSNIGSAISEAIDGGRTYGTITEVAGVGKYAVLAVVIRSRYLGLLDRIWSGSKRGKNDCVDFAAAGCPASHAAAARSVFSRFDEITAARRDNASVLASNLSNLSGITLPDIVPGAEPVYLRFPVIIDDWDVRRRLIAELRRNAINVSLMYSRASLESLRTFATRLSLLPNAEYLSDHILNLPVHPLIRPAELTTMVDTFHRILRDRIVNAATQPVASKVPSP